MNLLLKRVSPLTQEDVESFLEDDDLLVVEALEVKVQHCGLAEMNDNHAVCLSHCASVYEYKYLYVPGAVLSAVNARVEELL